MRVKANNRKGLSQILYLIIAASVLMMVAMVITFTATDVIGGAGSEATTNSCTRALQGQCASAADSQWVNLPSTCVKNGQYVGAASNFGADIYTRPGGSNGPGEKCGDDSGEPPCNQMYIQCMTVTN